jgi:hypothetical protein
VDATDLLQAPPGELIRRTGHRALDPGVGCRLGLDFAPGPTGDWRAPIGAGRALLVYPSDPNLVAFTDETEAVFEAFVHEPGAPVSFPRYDGPGADRWFELVAGYVASARSGTDLERLAARIDGTAGR